MKVYTYKKYISNRLKKYARKVRILSSIALNKHKQVKVVTRGNETEYYESLSEYWHKRLGVSK